MSPPRGHGSIIQNSQEGEQPERPLTDEWIKQTWSLQTAEYHAALRRKGVLAPATTRTDRGDVLTEVSQWQQDKCRMLPPHMRSLQQSRSQGQQGGCGSQAGGLASKGQFSEYRV